MISLLDLVNDNHAVYPWSIVTLAAYFKLFIESVDNAISCVISAECQLRKCLHDRGNENVLTIQFHDQQIDSKRSVLMFHDSCTFCSQHLLNDVSKWWHLHTFDERVSGKKWAVYTLKRLRVNVINEICEEEPQKDISRIEKKDTRLRKEVLIHESLISSLFCWTLFLVSLTWLVIVSQTCKWSSCQAWHFKREMILNILMTTPSNQELLEESLKIVTVTVSFLSRRHSWRWQVCHEGITSWIWQVCRNAFLVLISQRFSLSEILQRVRLELSSSWRLFILPMKSKKR